MNIDDSAAPAHAWSRWITASATRMLGAALAVAWLLTLAAGMGYALLVQLRGSTYCEPSEGSSQYGDLSWSVLPPGPTCRFSQEVHGFDATRGPTPVMSIWIAALLLGACVILVLALIARGSRPGLTGRA